MQIIAYNASPTISEFHRSNKLVRSIIGPIGSGKSVGCIMEMLRRSFEQAPNAKRRRRTRWAVIRNTYRELIDTTLKSFFDWVPESSGTFVKIDMTFTWEVPLPDGTVVEAEFLFRALDRPKDVKKLLSLELTGGFINECREVPKSVVDMLQGRCGRFPAKRDVPPTWYGIIMDTNPPDSDSWFYKLFEENCPENFAIFRQPSGLAPNAENIENLPEGYYTNMVGGKDSQWVDVYVHGKYGFVSDGKPVFPEYNDKIHAIDEFKADPTKALYVGIDFGLTPAAVIGQVTTAGRLVIFDELVTFDMGAVNFGRLLKKKLNTQYQDFKDIQVYADPAGEQRAQTDELTPFLILHQQGIMAYPTYTNDFTIRREVIADMLMRLDFTGSPAFALGPKAIMLRKAFGGGYKYKRMQVSGVEERYMESPDKNRYSHVSDAAQYLALGALGGGRVIGDASDGKTIDYTRNDRAVT